MSLEVSSIRNLFYFHVVGDLNIIIDWENGRYGLSVLTQGGWKRKGKQLQEAFNDISFSHVYRELTSLVDSLEKDALVPNEEIIVFEEVSC